MVCRWNRNRKYRISGLCSSNGLSGARANGSFQFCGSDIVINDVSVIESNVIERFNIALKRSYNVERNLLNLSGQYSRGDLLTISLYGLTVQLIKTQSLYISGEWSATLPAEILLTEIHFILLDGSAAQKAFQWIRI